MTIDVDRPSKAKRKLSSIDFQKEGSHIALVSKDQGGGANGHNYTLIMKAANFSEDFIKKASMITVTLEITDFLQKFFGVYGSDAEVLARTLGFTTEMQEDESEYDGDWYENYIQNQVNSFQLMKSMYDAEDITNILSTLNEDQYLQVLEDQSKLEKALEDVDKNKDTKNKTKTRKTKTTRGYTAETSTDVVSASVSKADQVITQDKDKKMQLEKALEEKNAELQKALEEITLYKAKEKEAITKARFAELKEAVSDEEKAKVLFKAVDLVQDPVEFTSIVKVLADLSKLVEKSELFTEKGATVKEETPVVKESAVAKAVKAQITKQTK